MNSIALTLWHRRLTADDSDVGRFWNVLDEEERARAASFSHESGRQRFIAMHGHLRSILAQAVHEQPQYLKIARTGHGKPYLVDHPELAFNLSHTANTMVVAVGSGCRLGVDAEICKPRTSLPSLVERCFADIESAWWNTIPNSKKNREFYRMWTRKEAFVKAAGRGIALGLNRCVIDPENPAAWLSVPPCCGMASNWHSRIIDLEAEVCCAVVADQPISVIELIGF